MEATCVIPLRWKGPAMRSIVDLNRSLFWRRGVISLNITPGLGKSGTSRMDALILSIVTAGIRCAPSRDLDDTHSLGQAPEPLQSALFQLPNAFTRNAEL